MFHKVLFTKSYESRGPYSSTDMLVRRARARRRLDKIGKAMTMLGRAWEQGVRRATGTPQRA
jgi:hypothetical protein